MVREQRLRSDVENLLLAEMVEEDVDYIMAENAIDDMIPDNTVGLFGDISSEEDEIIDDDDLF